MGAIAGVRYQFATSYTAAQIPEWQTRGKPLMQRSLLGWVSAAASGSTVVALERIYLVWPCRDAAVWETITGGALPGGCIAGAAGNMAG